MTGAAEKAVYDQHQNSVDDPGYRQFLSGSFLAVADRVPAGARGLDFGCGPGPALADMLQGEGYPVALYDVYYYPDKSVLGRQYDFICLTEVIEHLGRPAMVLPELWDMLCDRGWLVIQTQRVRNRDAFIRWRYPDDPTHIAFYAETTFAWLANHLGACHWELVTRDVVVFQK
jgi:2-polyprenyl-3-methyl-5-hydroxy-6-metoxy-1,4-benzoquinol methylase